VFFEKVSFLLGSSGSSALRAVMAPTCSPLLAVPLIGARFSTRGRLCSVASTVLRF
jgi:hypothetical protein